MVFGFAAAARFTTRGGMKDELIGTATIGSCVSADGTAANVFAATFGQDEECGLDDQNDTASRMRELWRVCGLGMCM